MPTSAMKNYNFPYHFFLGLLGVDGTKTAEAVYESHCIPIAFVWRLVNWPQHISVYNVQLTFCSRPPPLGSRHPLRFFQLTRTAVSSIPIRIDHHPCTTFGSRATSLKLLCPSAKCKFVSVRLEWDCKVLRKGNTCKLYSSSPIVRGNTVPSGNFKWGKVQIWPYLLHPYVAWLRWGSLRSSVPSKHPVVLAHTASVLVDDSTSYCPLSSRKKTETSWRCPHLTWSSRPAPQRAPCPWSWTHCNQSPL